MEKVVTKVVKPFQSALKPFEREIFELKSEGRSLRAIAAEMKLRHGLDISHKSVASFIRTHRPKRRSFLDGLSNTRRFDRRPQSGTAAAPGKAQELFRFGLRLVAFDGRTTGNLSCYVRSWRASSWEGNKNANNQA